MRVVVDTNVVISAALKANSVPAAVLDWVKRNGRLLTSAVTTTQLFDVLDRPRVARFVPKVVVNDLREFYGAAELVDVASVVSLCRDPSDDRFLELALSGLADVLITGDQDLLVLDPFQGIPIVTPAAFMQRVRGDSLKAPHPSFPP